MKTAKDVLKSIKDNDVKFVDLLILLNSNRTRLFPGYRLAMFNLYLFGDLGICF